MDNKFVTKEEFFKQMMNIQVGMKEIRIKLSNLTDSVSEINVSLQKLKKILIESNGGDSMVETVRQHSEAITRLVEYVEGEKQSKLKKFNQIMDSVWKYGIRLVVLLTLLGFLSLLLFHNPELKGLFKILFRAI